MILLQIIYYVKIRKYHNGKQTPISLVFLLNTRLKDVHWVFSLSLFFHPYILFFLLPSLALSPFEILRCTVCIIRCMLPLILGIRWKFLKFLCYRLFYNYCFFIKNSWIHERDTTYSQKICTDVKKEAKKTKKNNSGWLPQTSFATSKIKEEASCFLILCSV